MTISFLEDLREKKLYPIKLLLFCQMAGDMALFPFFTLHMKSLGISLSEIGIQFAISPIASLIATPLVGLIADKMGNYKLILSSSLLLCAVISLFMLNVPTIKKLPECVLKSQYLTIDCPNHSNPIGDNLVLLNISLPECLIRKNSTYDKDDKNMSISLSLVLVTLNNCKIKCQPSNIDTQVCLYNELDGHYCFLLENAKSSHLSDKNLNTKTYLKDPLILDISPNVESLKKGNKTLDAILNTITYDNTRYLDITCKGNSSCKIYCPIEKENTFPYFTQRILQDPASKRFTFWIYLLLRIILIIIIIIEISMLKTAILTLVEECNSEYGYQRIWSSLGIILIPPIVGIISDKIKKSGDTNTFVSSFYVYCAFKVLMATISYFINLDIKPPSLKIWKRLNEIIKSKEVGIFLFFVTIIGTFFSFIEIYIVWYLEELNASRSLIGLSFSIAAMSGIPFLIFAGSIQRKLGSVLILVLGLLTYSIRFIGYSYAKSAFAILIFETLEGITSTLVFITMTMYASTLSTLDLLATLQATWTVMHFSVGRAIGAMIGGYLMESFGSRKTFQIFSALAFFAACVYYLLYIFYLRNKEIKRRELQGKTDSITSPTKEQMNTLKYTHINDKINESFRHIETARKSV